jgi:hypothetical protein
MAVGTQLRFGFRFRSMTGRQPSGRVIPAHDQGLLICRIGPRTIIPASGQQEDEQQQKQERLQRSFSYL